MHREEDAAVNGLEAVADVGEGAPDDNGHGVVDVGGLHLRADVAQDHILDGVGHQRHLRLGLLILNLPAQYL